MVLLITKAPKVANRPCKCWASGFHCFSQLVAGRFCTGKVHLNPKGSSGATSGLYGGLGFRV